MVDWTKKSIVPRNGLLAWHQYEMAASGHDIIYDYSGNTRIVQSTGGNSPVLQANVLNGQPGWYFDGSVNPLIYNGSILWKHIFILASHEDAAFNLNRGLLSGPTSGDALVSNSSGDTFFNLSYGSPFQYRKNGVAFAENNQKAPMNNQAAVIELTHTAGIPMDGIQIGQQRTLDSGARDWKGWFFDDLIYDVIQPELGVINAYRYFAMRYWVWQQNADGLYVFPFIPNKTTAVEIDQENYLSEPYDGDPKALTRGVFKGQYQLPFLLREQEEFLAAKAFHAQHYRLGKFVYRDYRYYPYKEVKCRFASPIREQGSDVTYRFNYSFEIVEVD